MKISFEEITIKIKILSEKDRPHPNLLANAFVTINGPDGYVTITGFTVWKSKYGEKSFNIEVPKKKNFKYLLVEKSLWNKIKIEVIKQFEYENIPICNN